VQPAFNSGRAARSPFWDLQAPCPREWHRQRRAALSCGRRDHPAL